MILRVLLALNFTNLVWNRKIRDYCAKLTTQATKISSNAKLPTFFGRLTFRSWPDSIRTGTFKLPTDESENPFHCMDYGSAQIFHRQINEMRPKIILRQKFLYFIAVCCILCRRLCWIIIIFSHKQTKNGPG